ncbi:MAG: ThiF family adenylyltransferase [Phycisphaerae bacterium]|nr:ThiF family adenylyltransferase [Tepidisphaeraceae bacterium]
MTSPSRYHRQSLLPQIGSAGQERLARARVLLVGCGALGTTIADQLVRAGVGHLTVVDRDVVEATNLQRQTLFDERDATAGAPKAVAAADRLRAVNSSVEITPVVTDVHSGNSEGLLGSKTDLILDGTDNVSTRYLINDVAVKHDVPWVYGAAVATEGRVMSIFPGRTPCLRCLFPNPPAAHELPTCDTAGVLGMGAAVVGAFQAMQAIKILVGATPEAEMLALDFWPWRVRTINTAEARRDDCPCCGMRRFEFLAARPDSSLTLCGRNAIQIRPTQSTRVDLPALAERIRPGGRTEVTPHLVRCHLSDPDGVTLTVFADGRTLIQGVTDPGRARALHARWVGA